MYKELELKAGRIPKKNIGVNNIKVNASGLSYMYIVIEYSHMYMCLSEVVDYDCLMQQSYYSTIPRLGSGGVPYNLGSSQASWKHTLSQTEGIK